MPNKRGYDKYIHTIKNAYRSMNISTDFFEFPSAEVVKLSAEEALAACYPFARKRLEGIEPGKRPVFEEPRHVVLHFHNSPVIVPLINDEGVEWYSNTPMQIYDFLAQSFLGMHNDAQVIYDVGGHQGVYALYYSGTVGPNGRVHTFEPSIVNVECAALSFFINGKENITLNAFGIAAKADTILPYENGLLVNGIRHSINLLPFTSVMWDKPDFIKIDIEGYEYDLITSTPHIFEIVDNLYLELHIPFMMQRGLNYRDVYEMIPFDRFRVRTHDAGRFKDLKKEDELEGFTALMLTRI